MTAKRFHDIFTYHTLSNGLKIVHKHQPGCNAEYCGLAVKAGSRNETPSTYGLAHFVEHTIFKGTDKRHAWHILNRMESVGGELNAYTSEEVTMVYSGFPRGNLTRAIELIADLISHSRFPEAEIERERDVILDEWDSYLDTPADAIFDDFNDLMFHGSSLGHNILGTPDTIRSFTSDDCRNFLTKFYVPSNMTMFFLGSTPPQRVFDIAERYLGILHHPTPDTDSYEPPLNAPFDLVKSKSTHQSHTVIGARIPGLYADKNRSFALLNNMLGGPSMNSRLNVELRERRGYVYSVDSYTSLFSDCGQLTIYFGCDKKDIPECRRIIFDILREMAEKPLKPRALAAAKKQYIGQSIVSAENREQLALSIGRATLFNGKVFPADEVLERIMSITPDDICQAAEWLLPEKCSILTFC